MFRWAIRGSLALLVAVVVAGTSVRAADPEETDSQKLDRLVREVTDLRKSIDELRKAAVQRDLIATQEMRVLDERLNRLEALLRQMNASGGTTRISSSFTPGDTVTPAMGGTVRLRNFSDVPATVVINGQSYRVQPGEMRTLTRSLGNLDYEVFADGFGRISQGVQSRTLVADRPLEITINPRPMVFFGF